ncbi:ATP-binding protein [Streptomyces sp. 8K308]|nr:ATP-binding protein [Streptomyces sp. 8K308]
MEVTYQHRLVDPLLAELVAEVPVVSLVGPRASGKTTTARKHAATVIHLDTPGVAEVFRTDPDAALRGLAEPVLLDEWQEAPEVLGAVKRTVDADPRAGRYLLTGSVRAELDSHTWPGTGRVIHVPMTGLSMREKVGNTAGLSLVERLTRLGPSALSLPEVIPDVRDYVDMALRGSFPEPALRLSDRARRRWFTSYVQQLLTRDAATVQPRRDPERLRRYFEALALNTAGVVEHVTLLQAAGIDRRTAVAYEHLLSNLFVLDVVPAWFTNRLKRLGQAPKRYLVDPALAGAVVGADTDTVLQDSDLLGRLIDTFVVAQLRAELPLSDYQPRIHHLRQDGGRKEVDVLVEFSGHRVIAIEIKAASNPGRSSARHLTWLRDELGERFVHGLVFHTGQYIQQLDDRITAVPICVLWG